MLNNRCLGVCRGQAPGITLQVPMGTRVYALGDQCPTKVSLLAEPAVAITLAPSDFAQWGKACPRSTMHNDSLTRPNRMDLLEQR